MHFCFLLVQDSPVSLLSLSLPSPPFASHRSFYPRSPNNLFPSLLRPSPPPPHSPYRPLVLSSFLLARHSFCRALQSPLSALDSSPACFNIAATCAGVLHPFVLHASYHRLPRECNQPSTASRARLLFLSFASPPRATACLDPSNDAVARRNFALTKQRIAHGRIDRSYALSVRKT